MAGVLAAIMAFLLAVLAISQIVSALFGFWENEASKASLEGLPPYITYEMVEEALACQEEYGHPAGCTIAQIIVESGQGDHLSGLATQDHNLFGMKWSSSYALCEEVAGRARGGPAREYGGEQVTVTADFISFVGDAECIRFPQSRLPAGRSLRVKRAHTRGGSEPRLGQDGRGAQGCGMGDELELRRA